MCIKQEVHNAIAHCPLTDAQPIPEQRLVSNCVVHHLGAQHGAQTHDPKIKCLMLYGAWTRGKNI